MPTTTDPFSMVHTALLEMAWGSSAVRALVKPGNFIRLDLAKQWNNLKPEAQAADYPELSLEVISATGNLRATSSSSMIARQFQFLIRAGSVQANFSLLPVEFALFAALGDWVTVLTDLRWPADAAKGFVTNANIISAEQGRIDDTKNEGIQQWSAIWTCEVQMHFKIGDLHAYGAGT